MDDEDRAFLKEVLVAAEAAGRDSALHQAVWRAVGDAVDRVGDGSTAQFAGSLLAVAGEVLRMAFQDGSGDVAGTEIAAWLVHTIAERRP